MIQNDQKVLRALILFIIKVIMNTLNAVILIVLFLSPFIYLPIISKQMKNANKGLSWYLLTFSIGIIQDLFYLIILFILEIPIR